MRQFAGGQATVTEIPYEPAEALNPSQTATLSFWFVDAPGVHPLWPQYTLCMVHLRDIEGQDRPPHRRTPAASHELMVVALNPELKPWTAENLKAKMLATPKGVSNFLEPLNVCEQLENLTDDQAKELTQLVARSLSDGHLPIECDDMHGGRAWWRQVLDTTCEHLRTGTHPSRN